MGVEAEKEGDWKRRLRVAWSERWKGGKVLGYGMC